MNASLKFEAEILKGTKPAALSSAVSVSAVELESNVKTNMQRSIPAGRTYRLGSIVRKSNRRNAVPGLVQRGSNVVVGSKFYRASKRGQPPAIRTGRLFNSIGSRRTGPLSARVSVSVAYAMPLDDPEGLDRPFFQSQAVAYFPRFQQNVKDAYLK
jgi:hypothetical protein